MEQIIKSLQKIQQEKNVQILYACETGSRAWGFPSPDSDYDVRFIYKHEMDWYLSLGQRKDTLEFPLKDDFDVTGWDLRKSLVLLKKSNAALIERFQSPIVYCANRQFTDEFIELVKSYYSPIAVFYHHYSLAKKFREVLVDSKEVKLKSYFYFIRSLLSCNWILISTGVVPMHMEGLLQVIEKDKADMIRELIEVKSGVGEKHVYQKVIVLDDWLESLWTSVEVQKDRPAVNDQNYALLNSFYKRALYGAFDDRLG